MSSVQKNAADLHINNLVDCPKCGTSNPQGTRHCVNCGASLAGIAPRAAKPIAEKKGFFSRLFKRK